MNKSSTISDNMIYQKLNDELICPICDQEMIYNGIEIQDMIVQHASGDYMKESEVYCYKCHKCRVKRYFTQKID